MGNNEDEHLHRGNLLWEGSRMFLPEHREQLLDRRRRDREYRMPELDEEWLAEMSRMLNDSLEQATPITIIYGSTYHREQFTGIVRQIDPYDGWVRLTGYSNNDHHSEDEHGSSGCSSPKNDDPHSEASGSGACSEQQVRIAFRQIVDIHEA